MFLLQGEIYFKHSGIQPNTTNAQISKISILIPRYKEDSDKFRY